MHKRKNIDTVRVRLGGNVSENERSGDSERD